MSLPTTDKPLRDMIKKAVRKLRKIMSRFTMLDDPIWILKTDQSKINRKIDDYLKQVAPVIQNSFTGKNIEIISREALSSFAQAMKGVKDISVSETAASRLAKSVNRNQSELVKSVIRQMGSTKRLKAQTLKSMSISPAPGAVNIKKINGKKFDIDDIDAAWEVLTDQYGTSAQLQFQSGKKMPLDQYVDGKLNSLTQEVNNQIVIMESANNQIPTVKISSHRSPDSCRLHENEIAFLNKAVKKKFIKENPELASMARKIHTVEEIKADPTHMFSFDCKHRIIPFPIDVLPRSVVDRAAPSNKLPKNRKDAREATKKLIEAGT